MLFVVFGGFFFLLCYWRFSLPFGLPCGGRLGALFWQGLFLFLSCIPFCRRSSTICGLHRALVIPFLAICCMYVGLHSTFLLVLTFGFILLISGPGILVVPALSFCFGFFPLVTGPFLLFLNSFPPCSGGSAPSVFLALGPDSLGPLPSPFRFARYSVSVALLWLLTVFAHSLFFSPPPFLAGGL